MVSSFLGLQPHKEASDSRLLSHPPSGALKQRSPRQQGSPRYRGKRPAVLGTSLQQEQPGRARASVARISTGIPVWGGRPLLVCVLSYFLDVCVRVCLHFCKHAYEGQRSASGIFLYPALDSHTLFFEARSFPNLELTDSSRPARQQTPQILLSPSPQCPVWDCKCSSHTQFFVWVLGI